MAHVPCPPATPGSPLHGTDPHQALPPPPGLSRYVEGVRRGRGLVQPPKHLGESPRVEGPAGLVAELHAHVPTGCDAVHGARLSDKLWQVVETVAGRSRRAGGAEDARRGGHGASGWGSSPLPSWGSTRRGLPASPSGRLRLADTSPCPHAGRSGCQHSPCAAALPACLGTGSRPTQAAPRLPVPLPRAGGRLGSPYRGSGGAPCSRSHQLPLPHT